MRPFIQRTDARATAQSAGRGRPRLCPSHARAQRGGDDIGSAEPRFSAAPHAEWFTPGGQQREAQRLWQQYLQGAASLASAVGRGRERLSSERARQVQAWRFAQYGSGLRPQHAAASKLGDSADGNAEVPGWGRHDFSADSEFWDSHSRAWRRSFDSSDDDDCWGGSPRLQQRDGSSGSEAQRPPPAHRWRWQAGWVDDSPGSEPPESFSSGVAQQPAATGPLSAAYSPGSAAEVEARVHQLAGAARGNLPRFVASLGVEFAEGVDAAATQHNARRAFLLRFHPDLLRAQPAGEQGGLTSHLQEEAEEGAEEKA